MYKKETIKISIETIDNGYVTTVSNEWGILIASWYDVLKSDALLKIADQLGLMLPSKEEDNPLPFVKGLESRELTEVEAGGMDTEMQAIRDGHLKKGLKTQADMTDEEVKKYYSLKAQKKKIEEELNESKEEKCEGESPSD